MTLILPPSDAVQARPVVLPVDGARGRWAWPMRVTLRLPAGRMLPRVVGPAMMVLCGLVLWHRVEPGFGAEVVAALSRVSAMDWLLAVVATGVSFRALGQYDALIHAAARTGVAPARARAAGRRAIAVAQAAGLGAVTGALVRWRCLPELGLIDLGKVSVAVSLSFLAAWAVVTGAVALLVWGGLAGVVLLAGLALLAARLPVPRLSALPGLRRSQMAGMVAWTLVDLVAAAVVLWAFLPPGVDLSPALFLIAYLVALGAGMLSQSPGGLGAFELSLIGMLPQADPAALVAAALAYRLVYHIAPAALALGLMARPTPLPEVPSVRIEAAHDAAHSAAPSAAHGADRARRIAPHPDWGLVAQGAALLMPPGRRQGWMVRRAPGALVAVGPSLRRPAVAELDLTARGLGLMPLIYKGSVRDAAAARSTGWAVWAIAEEAVLDPTVFRLTGPDMAGLRRKLRCAEKAGLAVQSGGPLPLAEMAALNAGWAEAHGGERGFSMGRFCPALVADQAVLLARHRGRLVAFVTFHRTAAGWGLDLMRHGPDAPPGTMQALIAAGIAAAGHEGVTALSLAACPLVPRWPGPFDRLLDPQRKAAAGLRQFKAGFAPRWITRYAAAPNAASLVAGVVSVVWAVHRPAGPALSRRDFAFEIAGPMCEANDDHSPSAIPGLTPPALLPASSPGAAP